MEAVESRMPSMAPRALPPGARQGQRLSSQRNANAATLRASNKEARLKRTSPKGGRAGTRDTLAAKPGAKATVTRMASVTGKPLVPVTERRLPEDKHIMRGRKDADCEKCDIVPDGGSAGREGRHFAVANVGNNGMIYLRPTVRPAHQRLPQPNFTFPVTPPETAPLDQSGQEKSHVEVESEFLTSQWTPTPGASPFSNGKQYFPDSKPPHRPFAHRRALSESTIHESGAAKESDSGAFKVVISKPGEDQRPRTMEDLDSGAVPFLNINIPSWRIGTPRFSVRGTPVLRGSSYAPTEEPRSSVVSGWNRSQRTPNDLLSDSGSRKPSSLTVPQVYFAPPSPSKAPEIPSSRARPTRFTYLSTHLVIEPAMFDDLTFKPASDERSIVRYAPNSGAVTAATPPRLVAEITSPTFLDYELISDFFLAYRAFLESQHLLRMLIARLRWAIARHDQTGMVVRVRTFVALRHWILNYFMDDFVVDYHLRVIFCNLLNAFADELSHDDRSQKVQVRILGELKKCWRRVCAQYWDGPAFDDSLPSDAAIAPGGIAGHRDPDLDPSFWNREDAGPPQLDSLLLTKNAGPEQTSFFADILKTRPAPESAVLQPRPATPEQTAADGTPQAYGGVLNMSNVPTSPMSQASLDIVSCSFPGMTMRALNPYPSHPLAAHPVSSVSVYNNQVGPIAATPKMLTGKRVRPDPTHRRNNSLTDSLREHDPEKVSIKDQEFLMTSPHAGSLVRGNVLPPGQAFVDIFPPQGAQDAQRDTTVFQPGHQINLTDQASAGAMSGRGMRKLIHGVRRALSTREPAMSPTQESAIQLQSLGPPGATTNRLPGTAVVPQNAGRQTSSKVPVRIDLLGAEVAEDFKKAVREEAAAEAERRRLPTAPIAADRNSTYSVIHRGSETAESFLGHQEFGHASAADITPGSQSIVIVDDTIPTGGLLHHSSLHTVSPSVETFAETFMPTLASPTPPNTPPGESELGVPRRSSYLLNQHIINNTSEEPLPPFVPDLSTLGRSGSQRSRTREEKRQSAVSKKRRSSRQRPLAQNSFYLHRHKSSRTQRSINSILHRRNASYSSGIVPPSTARSFDATTTYSEASARSDSEVPMPQPLRALRRRPGGNLRDVNNVGELGAAGLRRSRSVGSLTTFSDSFRSSFVYSAHQDSLANPHVATSDLSPGRPEVFSLGKLAEKSNKRDLSLFGTYSVKPVMRPSFEIEAQKLAQIPDDEDDGGIESALLKLEGKYEHKSARLSMDLRDRLHPEVGEQSNEVDTEDIDPELIGVAIGTPRARLPSMETGISLQDKTSGRGSGGLDDFGSRTSKTQATQTGSSKHRDTTLQSFLSEGSQESYSSIPLLDRDLTDEGPSMRNTVAWTDRSVLQGFDDDDQDDAIPLDATIGPDSGNSEHLSFDFIQKTSSLEKIPPGRTAPAESEEQSFLDDESDNGSELSSELSVEDQVWGALEEGDEISPRSNLPYHPLGDPGIAPKLGQSSPETAAAQVAKASSPRSNIPELYEDQIWEQKGLPPTPEAAPTIPYLYPMASREDPSGVNDILRDVPRPDAEQMRKRSAHLPFILAFDSDVLAQQFTLIEKDALNEIDWKELVDMQWKDCTTINCRSWVQFLRNGDAQGVEVVIARFNIMVKWAISEIILTQNIEERARCIIKYIHIAANCRRYRNFATLAQLTIALTSNEIGRLTRTWSFVPQHELATLQELETLVTPTRNFYNLRAEMEGGSGAGCIPFVMIYTHDLLYNAQRPSEIASSPTTAPLVNFERCRIAAAVVKTLLRLLESSTQYTFQPIEGVTERCLWMGALSDEEIRRQSQVLE